MKDLNYGKLRFVCIFLTILFTILGCILRNYFRIFISLAWICIALNSICFYIFESKDKDHSSKFYILGAIILVILVILYWLF